MPASVLIEELSSGELVGLIQRCESILNKRKLEMFGAEDLAKRTDVQEEFDKQKLINKYESLSRMIENVGKSNAGEYIHEKRKVAEILWDDFGIAKEETANPIMKAEPDMVNHPPHYTTGNIEVIDFIDDKQLGFYEGQVIKYVSRAKLKGNEIEDLKKAQWYLNRLIEKLDGKKENATNR